MWVPVVSLVWTIMYLVQSRFAPVKLKILDTTSDDENKSDSRDPKGECIYEVEDMVNMITGSYPRRARINYNTVTLLGLSLGLAGGWTSPYLAKLTSPNSELPVTNDEASWIASLLPLGRVIGAIVGSIEIAYFGSKFSVLCTGIPVALSWMCLIIANSAYWIYLGRALQGICIGMFFTTFPLYAGEVANPKIRGAVIAVVINASATGFIVGNLMGALTPMWLFSIISLVPTIIFLVFFARLPSSPHYLVSRNRLDEATEALVWYQRDTDAKMEIESLRDFVNSKSTSSFSDTLRELKSPGNRQAFIMVALVFIFLQVGGTIALAYYMEIVLKRAGVKTFINPDQAVVGIGIFSIMGGFLSVYANDRLGRKVLLSGCCWGFAASMCVLGIQYVLLEHGYVDPRFEWLPLVAMTAVEFFVNLGISPVPSTILSEMFSPHTKSISACAANVLSGLFAFVSTRTYQPMIDVMPDQYVVWFYGIVMASLAIYITMTLPETKGKSLQEIQDMLSKKKHSTPLIISP